MEKAVFLDRDGTINIEKNYLYRPEDFEFIEGAKKAIKLLNDNNYKVIVVTNQAGVARGYYSEQDVIKLHEYVNEMLRMENAHIDDFFYCPHHPEHGIGKYKVKCNCRKPGTEMFEHACRKYNIDVSKSWMIGDNVSDIEAGNAYKLRTILVSTGYGKKIYESNSVKYDIYKENLLKSAEYIISTNS